MTASAMIQAPAERRAALLTLAFGTSTAMWILTYIARFIPGMMPSWPLSEKMVLERRW